MNRTQKLIDTIARLNPDAGEIGAGMLANIVAEARAIQLAGTQAAAEPREWLKCDACGKDMRGHTKMGHCIPSEPAAVEPATVKSDLVRQFENAVNACTRYHTEYIGKEMPEREYERFARLRDETIPRLRAALLDALAEAAAVEPAAQAEWDRVYGLLRHWSARALKAEAALAAQSQVEPAKDKTFPELWKAYEDAGYRYGNDALENVRFGFEIARGKKP